MIGRPQVWLVACAVTLCVSAPAFAQRGAKAVKGPDNDTCLACHGDPTAKNDSGRVIGLDGDKFGASVHGALGLACVDCHKDLAKTTDFPHAEKLAPVNCATLPRRRGRRRTRRASTRPRAGRTGQRRGDVRRLPQHA